MLYFWLEQMGHVSVFQVIKRGKLLPNVSSFVHSPSDCIPDGASGRTDGRLFTQGKRHLQLSDFFRLAGKTFFARGDPQARLTARRCLVMMGVSIRLFVVETVHWIALALNETLYGG